MRDALSQLLAAGGAPLTVVDEKDQVAGLVTLELLGGLLGNGALHDGATRPGPTGSRGGGGAGRGALTFFAAAGPVIPTFGGGGSSFACERANRLFCSGWVSRNWGSVLWPALRQHIVLTLIAVSSDS